jgi:hypothetical protein
MTQEGLITLLPISHPRFCLCSSLIIRIHNNYLFQLLVIFQIDNMRDTIYNILPIQLNFELANHLFEQMNPI